MVWGSWGHGGCRVVETSGFPMHGLWPSSRCVNFLTVLEALASVASKKAHEAFEPPLTAKHADQHHRRRQ